MEPEDKDELEKILDAYSLHEVLASLAEIASEKEEHVATTWQDRELAKLWRQAGQALDRLSGNAAVMRVSGF